jgi:hypothetical protein
MCPGEETVLLFGLLTSTRCAGSPFERARPEGSQQSGRTANSKWIADFTYVWTAEDWLYVAAVILGDHDAQSRLGGPCRPALEGHLNRSASLAHGF